MFIIYALLLGILIGYTRGGKLKWIMERPLHKKWLAFCPIAIQLVIFSKFAFVEIIPQNIISALHIISYMFLIVFIIVNFKIPGIGVIGTGALLNFLVIYLNGGYMPSASIEHFSNAKFGSIDSNIIKLSNETVLPWLGDIFHLPPWLPLTNGFSIGDILIAVGVCIYFAMCMKPGEGWK